MTSWHVSNRAPSTAVAVAGRRLLSGDGALSATLGLMVADLDGHIFALTVASICAAGKPRLECPTGNIALGAPAPFLSDMAEEDSCVEMLLALVPVPVSLLTDPLVPGLANIHGIAAPFETSAKELLVAGQPFPAMSRYGKTIALRDHSEQTVFYSNAVEIPLMDRTLQPGSAGALVATDDGRVVGLVVGATNASIYAAPVAEILQERNLVPLDWRTAARHELFAVRQSGPVESAEPGDPGKYEFEDEFSDVYVSVVPSTAILERYDPRKIVEEVERRVLEEGRA
jgi:hypothetical protein